jgi:hypothetical protein
MRAGKTALAEALRCSAKAQKSISDRLFLLKHFNFAKGIRCEEALPSPRVYEIKGGATECERPKSLQIDQRECNNAGQ